MARSSKEESTLNGRSKELRAFLTKDRHSDSDARPLFRSIREFALEVEQGKTASGKPTSAVSMMYQKIDGSRQFSQTDVLELQKVVDQRIEERVPTRRDDLNKRFSFLLDQVMTFRHLPGSEAPNSAPSRLSASGITFVIAPYIREAISTPKGEHLIRAFSSVFGLQGIPVPKDKRRKYLLAFRDEEDLLAFLGETIIQSINHERENRDRSVGRAEHLQRVLDRIATVEENGTLVFALLPTPYCLASVVIYNCERKEGMTTMLSYPWDGALQFSELTGPFRQGYRQVYDDLYNNRIPGAQFVRTASVRDKLVQRLPPEKLRI